MHICNWLFGLCGWWQSLWATPEPTMQSAGSGVVVVGKFAAVVVGCGLYQGHNDVCITWTDQKSYASRAACIARTQEIKEQVINLAWYAKVEIKGAPLQRCRYVKLAE